MTDAMPSRTALRRMPKAELARWAEERCLLEHLDRAEVEALSKAALLREIDGALLFISVWEDRRALATDTVAKPVSEIIGYDR